MFGDPEPWKQRQTQLTKKQYGPEKNGHEAQA